MEVVWTGSRNCFGREFHLVGPATEKARRTSVGTQSIRWHNQLMTTSRTQMMSWCSRRDWNAVNSQVLRAVPFRQCRVIMPSVYLTRSGMSSQWSSACIRCVRPRSNFRLPLTTRSAAFNTRCSLLVIVFGAPVEANEAHNYSNDSPGYHWKTHGCAWTRIEAHGHARRSMDAHWLSARPWLGWLID